ncbi:trypsin-like peptidase domain-containing protein [Gammaproteobacteria bacterium]|nr:trypsin-like peptidase domain-containing protein [Gammaproteobacteria bacterium]
MKRLLPILLLLFSVGVGAETISHTFSSGLKYVGEVKNRKIHGQGTMTWPSGTKYVGEWKDGKQHGQGTKTYAKGKKYVGEWKDNKEHGQGIWIGANGDKYVGEWNEGEMHGQGTFTFSGGSRYVGEWKEGEMHGQGTQTWAEGPYKKYTGHFYSGMAHGRGKLLFRNDNTYVGHLKKGARHGQGVMTYDYGDEYLGEYIGEWKDDKWHGQGTYTFADERKYVGEWKDGKSHGQGTFTSPDGEKYVGEYKDNKRHGQGTYTHADGTRFVGEFKAGHGWNTIKYNNLGQVIGKRIEGMSVPVCGNKKGRSWGTGFAVNQDHVVTNAHVLYCCKKVTVFDLLCSNEAEAAVVSTEQKSDLGLLRLDKSRKHYATLRSGNELGLGELVSVYERKSWANACPQYVFGRGKVTKLNWMVDDFRLMKHDARASEGSSGGPILGKAGSVIGVHQRGVQGLPSSGVKSHLLKGFLKSNNVAYKTAPSTEELSLSEIKKKSDKFTVIINCLN